jgi:ribonucleoside-diphosphate reductase alpha chain
MSTVPNPQLSPTRYLPSNPLTDSKIRVCPECAGPVVSNSGCVSCRQCGWSRCG